MFKEIKSHRRRIIKKGEASFRRAGNTYILRITKDLASKTVSLFFDKETGQVGIRGSGPYRVKNHREVRGCTSLADHVQNGQIFRIGSSDEFDVLLVPVSR